jgi:hypothetical protein
VSVAAPAAPPKLAYAFVPNPNPIRASAGGLNPNSFDLQVIVSNPTLSPVTIRQIIIGIPTGEEMSQSISSARDLPAPRYDTSAAWKIGASASTVTIAPTSGATMQITSPIVFTLPGIHVNHTPGTVPLIITEFPASGEKAVDGTHSLVKLPSDFPVVSYHADPATLDDLQQTVKLYWKVSDEAKHAVYGLRAAGVGPTPHGATGDDADDEPPVDPNLAASLKPCVPDGNCYTWKDGKTAWRPTRST